MHSDRTHSGVQSHLFNSMRSYLCNQNRLQPIIGLNSVVELCTDNEPPVYLCEVCVLRMKKTDIKTHIMGSLHRCNYIRSCRDYGLKADTDLTSVAWRMMELAKVIEKSEGTGYVQVLHVDGVLYKEMMSQPVANVLAQIKEMNKQTKIDVLGSNLCNKLAKDYYFCSASPPVESHTAELSPVWASSSWASSTVLPEYKPPQSLDHNSREAPLFSRASSQSRTLPGTQDSAEEQSHSMQSSVRTIIQARNSSPPFDQIPQSQFKSSIRYQKSPSRTFCSVSAPRYYKGWSHIGSPGQHDAKHESRIINTVRCTDTKSHQSNTTQTKELPCKRVAQCQNNSLTVTIMQNLNQGNIRCQENTQDIPTLGTTELFVQDQSLDDSCIHEPPRHTHWLQTCGNALQEEQQILQPLGDSSFEVMSTTATHLVMSDHSPPAFTVQPSKLSEETPESYSGTLPLIGLQTVIKCESVDGDPPPCCYLCQPCSLKVLKTDLIDHLTRPQHQLNYINFQHPYLLVGMRSGCCGEEPDLQAVVKQLEQKEEKGHMKVMRLSACLYSEVLERDYHWCMKMLNCGSTKEVKPKQRYLMEKHSRTLDYNIAQKRRADSTGDHHSFFESYRGSKRTRPKRARHVEPMFKNVELAPETCRSTELYSDEHPEENGHSLGYTDVQTSTNAYAYTHDDQCADAVPYTTFVKGCWNSSQQPETSLRHMDCNSFLKDTFVATTAAGCPREETQPVSTDGTCHWLMEGNPITQGTSNSPKDHLMFVAGEQTQVMFVEQVLEPEPFGERNYNTINVPMHMYPAATGVFVPAINMYPSNPSQQLSQSYLWGSQSYLWGSSKFTGFPNQYSLNPY
ncbi:uncharacterized protein LOC143516966 isoform X2 [Brachyhypopomus gauderio]|uniref:uncharacterized protein LOC143516966 isoform X2 n=1 Tax=Brachyhypopomus gauderio TaxID=698409 RepID=UPI0040429700